MPTRRAALLLALGLAGPAAAAPRRRHAPGPPAAKPPPRPATTPLGPLATNARWAFVMDVNTGAVLLHKRADERMAPSSMAKLMTLYILFSWLKAGRLKLESMLPVSRTAWRFGGSKMFVEVGTTVSVRDLIDGVIVDSGNDACVVLAEAMAGSQAAFAAMMNAEAAKLGLTESHFTNPMGWPDPENYMSARDVALLSVALIRNFPQYYHFFSDRKFTYSNITQMNRNVLVDNRLADGLKTGHTDAGGYGIVVSAARGGRRVVVVVNGMPSGRDRTFEAERLLEWAFNSFSDVTLFRAGAPVTTAPVWLGTARLVPLVATTDVTLTLPHGWRQRARITVSYDSPLTAPIGLGEPSGQLRITNTGMADVTVPLVAGAAVPRLGLPGRAMAVLLHALAVR